MVQVTPSGLVITRLAAPELLTATNFSEPTGLWMLLTMAMIVTI